MNGFRFLSRTTTSNTITFADGHVKKTYKWKFGKRLRYLATGFIERKKPLWQTNQQRFERELAVLERLNSAGLNVPKVVGCDRTTRTIETENISGTDKKTPNLREALLNCSVDYKTKLRYVRDAFALLARIHAMQEYHGDSLAKNFFLNTSRPTSDSIVFGCDFEISRGNTLLDARIIDVLILVADVISALNKSSTPSAKTFQDVIHAFEEGYGTTEEIKFRFRLRDRIHYRLGFGMDKTFFEHFSV